jgi:RHS repeat-associated protein
VPQGKRFDAVLRQYDSRARIVSVDLMRALQPDPLGNPEGPSRYAWEGGNPINTLDPSGLFSSEVHRQITRNAGAGLSFKPGFLEEIAWAVSGVDYRPLKFIDYKYHAQERGWMNLVSSSLSNIRRGKITNLWDDGDASHMPSMWAHWLGYPLHALQDFYSHTDWVDGTDMLKVYKLTDMVRGVMAIPGMVVHPPNRGSTIPMRALLDGDVSYENVTYFTGGMLGGGHDDLHTRYAADERSAGRDRHTVKLDGVAAQSDIGIANAFNQAVIDATAQTKEVLKWYKDVIPCWLYFETFTDFPIYRDLHLPAGVA